MDDRKATDVPRGIAFDPETSHYTLSSGRMFYANRGIVGLGPDGVEEDGWIPEGYDGAIYIQGNAWSDPPEPAWTPDERAELSHEMIRRWTLFRDGR